MELATTSTMTDDYVFRFTAALQIRKVAGDRRQLGRLWVTSKTLSRTELTAIAAALGAAPE